MAKVILVNPPFYRLLNSRYNANSLGIAYISAVLNQNGHQCVLYNADYVNERHFANLKSLFNAFDDYKKYFENEDAPIWNEVVDNIIKYNPDWCGITMYTAALTAVKIISKKLKQKAKGIRIVVGGPHSTMDDQLLTKLPDVDYQVKREGEYAMLRLVNGEDPKIIPGVVSRARFGNLNDNGDYPPIKPIDQLPFPDRDNFYLIPEEEKKFIDVSYLVSIRRMPPALQFLRQSNGVEKRQNSIPFSRKCFV